jgi:hypothetical protein
LLGRGERQGDARIAPHIAELCVEPHVGMNEVVSVESDPDRGHLGLPSALMVERYVSGRFDQISQLFLGSGTLTAWRSVTSTRPKTAIVIADALEVLAQTVTEPADGPMTTIENHELRARSRTQRARRLPAKEGESSESHPDQAIPPNRVRLLGIRTRNLRIKIPSL